MVRIKVYKASQLAVVFAAVLLAAVLIAVVVSLALDGGGGASVVSEKIMDMLAAEEVTAAFSVFEPESGPIMPFFDGDDVGENEHTDSVAQEIIIEIVSSSMDEREPIKQPRVLIYHTHTHEAYEQTASDPYEAVEVWRTTDNAHSVVKVGKELAAHLRRYGFDVVHDTTDHEAHQLSTAYTRSLATLMAYKERFDLYIDLHRDAYVDGDPITVTPSGGEEMAPVMLLIGNGNGFDVKPWYAQNLSFARALESRINREAPGLCKPVLVKDGRYNQNIGVFSILVEVGHNRNTLAQACNSVSPLAKAIYALMVASPDPELTRIKAVWEAQHPFSSDRPDDKTDENTAVTDATRQ